MSALSDLLSRTTFSSRSRIRVGALVSADDGTLLRADRVVRHGPGDVFGEISYTGRGTDIRAIPRREALSLLSACGWAPGTAAAYLDNAPLDETVRALVEGGADKWRGWYQVARASDREASIDRAARRLGIPYADVDAAVRTAVGIEDAG